MSELLGRGEAWLGIDPDLHSTAFALASDKYVYSVAVVRAKGVIPMIEALAERLPAILTHRAMCCPKITGVVVEGQKYILGGKAEKATPEDLINLATITGAALAYACAVGEYELLRPSPSEWKGSVEKFKHQAQTCLKYGWKFKKMGGKKPYAVPDFSAIDDGLRNPLGSSSLNPGDWKHCLDAIGLARWGACHATPERLGLI